jgi:hypothetical protein
MSTDQLGVDDARDSHAILLFLPNPNINQVEILAIESQMANMKMEE